MSKIILQHIITSTNIWADHTAADSTFDISKEGRSFVYDDQTYTYHNSGLARSVYKSDCGKYVIKLPIVSYDFDKETIELFLRDPEKELYFVEVSICHNIGEAQAYEACPDKYKHLLAHTELLPNGAIRQEFVDVKKNYVST